MPKGVCVTARILDNRTYDAIASGEQRWWERIADDFWHDKFDSQNVTAIRFIKGMTDLEMIWEGSSTKRGKTTRSGIPDGTSIFRPTGRPSSHLSVSLFRTPLMRRPRSPRARGGICSRWCVFIIPARRHNFRQRSIKSI